MDVAVVGGGTAGALLAGGLALGSDRTVRLYEEGPDEVHPLSRRLSDQPRILVSDALRRMPERRPGGGGATLLSGRLIGGGWSVNHGVMMMPTDADLHAFAAAGGPDWAPDHLRALAGRITTDLDLAARGRPAGTGPVPLARPLVDLAHAAPATAALLEVCAAAGVPWSPDVNRDASAVCVSSYPYSSDRGERVSSATAVLGPARGRPNLGIVADTQVRRLVVRGTRAVAVEVAPAGGGPVRSEPVGDGSVVLSAGAFHTPQVLLRSGIGPVDHLRRCGIVQVLDLPGVGEGFRDHAKHEVTFALTPLAEDRPVTGAEPWAADPFGDRTKIHLRLRSSRATEDPDLDLQLRHDVDAGVMVLTVRILEQRLAGTVRLDPDDPDGLPVVDSGMLRDPEDLEVLVEGVRRGVALVEDPRLGGRYRLPEGAPRTEGEWRAAIAAGYGSYNHGIGTCRMGADADAVVDPALRLRGLENVLVVDGSVLPVLPHVTTNYPIAIVARWALERLLGTG